MSSLLEKFGIVFEGDASNVDAGLSEAESSSEALEKSLVQTDKVAESLGNSFIDMIGSAQGALAALFSVGASVTAVISTAQATDEIGKFSQTLGLNIEDVQAWSEAVVRSGGDVNGFRGSVEGLTRGLTDFAVTGSGTLSETFNRLGISATDAGGKVKSAFDVLPELADQFERMDAAESAGFGERLGLDQGTILLLQQGRQEVEALVARQRALGVATQEDYEIAALFNDTWADTKQLFKSLSVTSGSTVLPMLTDILLGVQKFTFFLIDHKALVAGFFIGLAAVITAIYLPAIKAALISTAALLSPFLAVAAAAIAVGAAIALIVDDIYNFIKGNESLTGIIFEKYPNIQKLIMAIGDALGHVIDVAIYLGGVMGEVFGGIASGALDLFLSGLDKIFGLINELLGLAEGMGMALAMAFENPGKALDMLSETFSKFAENIFGLLPDLSGAFDTIASFFGFGDSDTQNNLEVANNTFAEIESNPLNGQTSNSIATNNHISRNTSVSVGAVNVQTQSTDSAGMAAAAGGALSSELGNAMNNIDDGISY